MAESRTDSDCSNHLAKALDVLKLLKRLEDVKEIRLKRESSGAAGQSVVDKSEY